MRAESSKPSPKVPGVPTFPGASHAEELGKKYDALKKGETIIKPQSQGLGFKGLGAIGFGF